MLTVTDGKSFDWAGISLAECAQGNIKDSRLTYKLHMLLREKLEELNPQVITLFDEILYPAVALFAEMEYAGIDVSMEEHSRLETKINTKIDELTKSLLTEDFLTKGYNLNSSQDMAQILYLDENGLTLYPPERTPTDAPSTNQDTLKLLLVQINNELDNRTLKI